MYSLENISSSVPANKFKPPRLADSRMLVRNSLLDEHLGESQPYQYIFLEAQAGQGKTTTALQILSKINHEYVWYQVGKEDGDPLYLLAALLEGISRSIPGFTCPQLTELLERGELIPLDISRPVNLLMTALDQVVSSECTLVFDDLHLLGDNAQSLEIIDRMLETAPSNISFILLMRKPLPFKSKRVRFGSSTLYLGSECLSFSKDEITALFRILVDRTPDVRTIDDLVTQTEGWVMGVVLAAQSYRKTGNSFTGLKGHHDERIYTFLEEEVFGQLDQRMQQNLMKLSLLDEVVVELAHEITGEKDIGSVLLQLMEENCFIRSLDDELTHFSFHHIFRTLLNTKARQLLTEEEYVAILLQGSSYCLERDMVDKSMQYLLKAKAYGILEKLLEQWGMKLVFRNRLVTLGSTLSSIPPDLVHSSAWFCFYSGLVLQKTDPGRSLELLLRARKLFQKQQHLQGELLTIGELIYHHVVLFPNVERCAEFIDRGDYLFAQEGATLAFYCRANTAKNLAIGFFYIFNQFTKAEDYCRIAEIAAREQGAPSQVLEVLVSLGFIFLFKGKIREAINVAEQIHVIITGNECGLRGLLVGYYFLLQMLHIKGEYKEYYRLKEKVLNSIDVKVLSRTIVQAFITLYDISIATAAGELDHALQLADRNENAGFFATVNHLQNEMLATKALALAQCGHFDSKGRDLVERLLPETHGDGVCSYRLKLLLPLALASALGGAINQARRLAGDAIDLARLAGMELFEVWSRLLRVYFETLDNDDLETVVIDLQYCFKHMQREGYNHIRCFSPAILFAVLRMAVKQGVEVDFARQLAAEYLGQAITDDADFLPLLTISTLGRFELKIEGRLVAEENDFTLIQRQLLGLLISHPQLRISQEHAQTILWPDSLPQKARNRFDTLLYRLRKTLSDLLRDQPVKNYLVLEKGILSLRNCRIDSRDFIDLARQGMTLGRNQKWWQAGSKLTEALELWSGPYISDLLPGDQSSDYGWKLQNQLLKMALFWCPALAANGQVGEAVKVAERVHQELPTDEDLTQLLYELHVGNNDLFHARSLYVRYGDILRREGYTDDEVWELQERISALNEPDLDK